MQKAIAIQKYKEASPLFSQPLVFSLLLLAVFFFQIGCGTFLNTYHISDYHPKALSSSSGKKMITSEESRLVFMGLNFNTKYVDKAFHRLQAQCLGRRISGIHTRYSTTDRLLFWIYTIHIRGYCHS